MGTFKEYFLIAKLDRSDLNEDVSLFIETGWTLYGNPFVDKEGRYCQAVVK